MPLPRNCEIGADVIRNRNTIDEHSRFAATFMQLRIASNPMVADREGGNGKPRKRWQVPT